MKGRRVTGVGTRQARGVRISGTAAGGGAAELGGQYRLAGPGRAARHVGQSPRILQGLQQQHDDARMRVVNQVVDEVQALEVGFVTAAHHAGKAHAMLAGGAVHQRKAQPAALRHDAHRPRTQFAQCGFTAGVGAAREGHGNHLRDVEKARGIGAADAHAGLLRQFRQIVLTAFAFFTLFGKSGAEAHREFRAGGGTFGEDVFGQVGAHCDQHHVDGTLDVAHGLHRPDAADRVVVRTDEMQRAPVATLQQEVEDAPAQRGRIVAGADHGDAGRREERGQIHLAAPAFAGCHHAANASPD